MVAGQELHCNWIALSPWKTVGKPVNRAVLTNLVCRCQKTLETCTKHGNAEADFLAALPFTLLFGWYAPSKTPLQSARGTRFWRPDVFVSSSRRFPPRMSEASCRHCRVAAVGETRSTWSSKPWMKDKALSRQFRVFSSCKSMFCRAVIRTPRIRFCNCEPFCPGVNWLERKNKQKHPVFTSLDQCAWVFQNRIKQKHSLEAPNPGTEWTCPENWTNHQSTFGSVWI